MDTTIRTTTYTFHETRLTLDTETTDLGGGFTKTLTRHYDPFARPRSLAIAGDDYTTAFGYDTAGRLTQVWDHPELTEGEPAGNPNFTYGYTPNSGSLLATITGPVHTVTNTWDPTRDVLATKINAGTAGNNPPTPSSFHYTVNAIGQRKELRPVLDGNDPISTYEPSWDWDYNTRGELVEADDQSGANDRAYQFDAIGNREKAIDGLFDDLAGAPVNYTANALNQYTKAEGVTLPTTSYDFAVRRGRNQNWGLHRRNKCQLCKNERPKISSYW